MIDVIMAFLKKQNDEQVKIAIEKMKENEKSEEGMNDYIMKRARAEIDGNAGYIDDATVFGWAIHYLTEPNSALDIVAVKKEKPVVAVKKEKEKSDDDFTQLSLFDLAS